MSTLLLFFISFYIHPATYIYSVSYIRLPSSTYLINNNDFQEDSTKRRLIINYHPNGKVKERGYQGYYANKLISTGAFVGTWNYYNSSGNLIQSIYYHNDIPSKAFIQKKKYYPGRKIKSIEIFNNYELYESEIDSLGTWKYFDSKGKLIKEIIH